MIGTTSRGIIRLPYIAQILGSGVVRIARQTRTASVETFVGWGRRPTAAKARAHATRIGVPFVALEDGFLRSFGTGNNFPPLALVVDEEGIYYDATVPSGLECILESGGDLLEGTCDRPKRAMHLIRCYLLSKYNHAPPCAHLVLAGYYSKRVLVIDQTVGDMSVSLGGADETTFQQMLEAARRENPEAQIFVKTHPEVTQGRKGGYLTNVQDEERTVVLRCAMNPIALLEQMDRVYVVTSQMGFEALMLGKPVSVFGMPWYAGWGATDDRQACRRRTRKRTVEELFAAAYLHYTRYLDPVSHQRGDIFDVIDWLKRQREMAERFPGRMICVGFRRWKAANVKPLLSLFPERVLFVRNAAAAAELEPAGRDCLVHWGREAPAGLASLAATAGARLIRMEDGFVRSVGLGSDLIRPLSLVLDERGIYFDPSQASELEDLLNTRAFTDDDRRRAAEVRDFIVSNGITKYNIEPRAKADWPTGTREVVLVPGQVEDDASIRFGCVNVRTNLDLLKAARGAHPEAFIVYKPHPDVLSSNRKGSIALDAARRYADHIETRLSVVSCIEACDVVHTMTSLTGFDALLRRKRVVVYGRPFYAGWGLTEDVVPVARRTRQLALDELVAGALLHYPIYWDWDLKGYTTCEAVLRRIVEKRDALEASGGLDRLRVGYLRRQFRKAGVLLKAWTAGG